MNRILTALAIVTFALLAAAPAAPAADSPPPSAAPPPGLALARGNNAFATQLYRQLAPETGNLFFSPYGVSTALGMVCAGARGDTAAQIKKTLHFRSDQARLNKAFKRTNRELTSLALRDGFQLHIADGLSLTGDAVDKAFETTLRDDYDAKLFSGPVEQINAWVRRKTAGKINTILDRLSPGPACVLLNAIYFKGLWKTPFSKKLTGDEPFYLSSTRRVTVPMMHRRGGFKTLRGKDFQAVSIPYRGEDLSMVIFLPQTIDGLDAFQKRLTPQKLAEWLKRIDGRPVRQIDLFLPRFTMKTSYDLKAAFIKMGMKKAFEKNADFSGIRNRGGLWIGRINHKGFLEVNEQGTQAAAATAVELRALALRRYALFRADHPFLFLIRDNRSSLILFMGREVDPTKK